MEVGKVISNLLPLEELFGNRESPQRSIFAKLTTSEMNMLHISYHSSSPSQLKGGELKERIRQQAMQLYSEDPKLAENYLTLIEFLNDNAPEFIEKFVNMIDELLHQRSTSIETTKPALELKIEFHHKLQANLTYKTKGKEIKLHYEESIDFKMKLRIGIKHPIRKIDPIVIDMRGNGIKLSSLKDAALFDIDGDGKKERVNFIEGDDAFLFIDRNFNNLLDNGTELIGTNPKFRNGFEELKHYDTNNDKVIDEKDPIFKLLKIFQDKNKDKKISPFEVKSAKKAGIKGIYLNYKNANYPGNLIAYSSYSLNYKHMFIGDYYLNYQEEA